MAAFALPIREVSFRHSQHKMTDNNGTALPHETDFDFFLTAIWLSHGQLWAILEGTASLTQC